MADISVVIYRGDVQGDGVLLEISAVQSSGIGSQSHYNYGAATTSTLNWNSDAARIIGAHA